MNITKMKLDDLKNTSEKFRKENENLLKIHEEKISEIHQNYHHSVESQRLLIEKRLDHSYEIIQNLISKRFRNMSMSKLGKLEWTKHYNGSLKDLQRNIDFGFDSQGDLFIIAEVELRGKLRKTKFMIDQIFYTGSTWEISQYVRQIGYKNEYDKNKVCWGEFIDDSKQYSDKIDQLEKEVEKTKELLNDANREINLCEKRSNRFLIHQAKQRLKKNSSKKAF